MPATPTTATVSTSKTQPSKQARVPTLKATVEPTSTPEKEQPYATVTVRMYHPRRLEIDTENGHLILNSNVDRMMNMLLHKMQQERKDKRELTPEKAARRAKKIEESKKRDKENEKKKAERSRVAPPPGSRVANQIEAKRAEERQAKMKQEKDNNK